MPTSHFLAVCYADIFDYPLKEDELEKWQISSFVIARSPATRGDEAISKTKEMRWQRPDLIGTHNDNLCVTNDAYYRLPGREKIIKLRQQREKFSQQKLLIAQQVVKFLQKIPFIKLIAVTGALAMENSPKDDDIDLLIITEKNRLWLTRLLATITLELLRKRRHPQDKKFRNKVCLNMFLDEEYLLVPHKEQNLYTAHEICQVKPIYNQSQTYEKFMLANTWAGKYLPNGIDTRCNKEKAHNILISQYLNIVLDTLELIAFKLQYFYMKKRITRETVEKGRIMFHPRDTSTWVLKEFDKRVKIYYT